MQPYLQILEQKLEEILPRGDIDKLKAENRIQGLPLGLTVSFVGMRRLS